MRISADECDRGFHPNYMRAKVFLDGEELHYCVTADEEERIAIVYVVDEVGKLKIVDGLIVRTTRVGDVKIVIPPDA